MHRGQELFSVPRLERFQIIRDPRAPAQDGDRGALESRSPSARDGVGGRATQARMLWHKFLNVLHLRRVLGAHVVR